MKQKTLHISFTKNDDDLYHALITESAINYIPASSLARIYIREGIKSKKSTPYEGTSHEEY